MTDELDLDEALRHVDRLSPADKKHVLDLLEKRERVKRIEEARQHFLPFVKASWPDFIPGAHHTIMAEAFEDIANGKLTRLIINMPPRHTKSELASWLLPAWFLGKFPKKKIIQASNTEALAAGFGRKVRNLISGTVPDEDPDDDTPAAIPFSEIFPKVSLAKDSQAAAGWHTNRGGEYFAIGVNGKVTGKGGDIVIIDDPHSEQEARQAETSPEIFDGVYEWYTSGPRQRLQPGGAIIIVMCMTGDTPVLRPDGSETLLMSLRPGDEVATYENGRLSTARVANWQSSGVDNVYTVQTRSGRLLRANARHPFLVDIAGAREWVRLQDLKPGMFLVATKVARGQPGHKLGPGYAKPANPVHHIIENTRTPLIENVGTTANGKARPAETAARHRRKLEVYATPATSRTSHLAPALPKKTAMHGLRAVMASRLSSTSEWLRTVITAVTSAASRLARAARVHIGEASSASTIITPRESSEAYFATTAISLSGMASSPQFLSALQSTSDFTTDEIVSITPAGRAEVFDIEIERTENFIANGIVSHNTRWSKRDLTGQVLKRQAAREPGEDGDEWKVIDFPAILDEGEPTERSLWPAYWPLKTLKATKAELPVPKWKAQYQQKPTSEEGAIIKREAWRRWGYDPDPDRSMCPSPAHQDNWRNLRPPACSFVMLSIDTALKKNERADYSAFTTWGVFEVEDRLTGKVINNIILLSAWKARLEFPELKRTVRQFYREDAPDTILIEDKGSGTSLIQELRAMDIPVENFSFGRGRAKGTGMSNDKVARANMITDIFASGYVWAPERRFADECIEECAEFPNGDHDDYVDTVVQALLRFRSGGFIRTANDADDADEDEVPHRRRKYY